MKFHYTTAVLILALRVTVRHELSLYPGHPSPPALFRGTCGCLRDESSCIRDNSTTGPRLKLLPSAPR